MSQLLDALRRASRASRGHQPSSGMRPRGDVVLQTFGASQGRQGRSVRRAVALLAVVVGLGAVIWYGVQRAFRSDAGRTTMEQETEPASAPAPPLPESAPPAGVSRPPAVAAAGGRVRDTTRSVTPPEAAPVVSGPTSRAGLQRAVYRSAERDPPIAPTPYEEFQRAVEQQRAGDYEAALRIYDALLRGRQLIAEVHNNLGLLFQARGMPAEALRHFELAVAARPRYAAAHNNLGVVLLSTGRVGDAELSFLRAAELDSRDADAVINLALAQKAGGRVERARESLLHALGLAPRSAPAHYNLAVLSEQAGEKGRAVEHYQAFLDHAGAEHKDHVALVQSRLEALQRTQ